MPGIEDPAEGAFAGPETDHGGIEPDRRLVLGDAALGGQPADASPPRSLSGATGAAPARSSADCVRRPKASATFCWAITGSMA